MRARRTVASWPPQARYGASVFWTRPGLTLGGDIEDFIAYWQGERDTADRGIVEVIV
ncbi:MAG: hypothetical protein HY321_11545 [Armatimonadetes bacterium]|nr:hypothetical protein [Armatimonadota bacterium]